MSLQHVPRARGIGRAYGESGQLLSIAALAQVQVDRICNGTPAMDDVNDNINDINATMEPCELSARTTIDAGHWIWLLDDADLQHHCRCRNRLHAYCNSNARGTHVVDNCDRRLGRTAELLIYRRLFPCILDPTISHRALCGIRRPDMSAARADRIHS